MKTIGGTCIKPTECLRLRQEMQRNPAKGASLEARWREIHPEEDT